MLAVLVAVAAGTVVQAPVASACTTSLCAGFYMSQPQQGTTFRLISGDNHLIIPANLITDNMLTTLSGSSAGAFKLPFKLNVFGGFYSSVRVSSNGNLQFCGSTTCGSADPNNVGGYSSDFPNGDPVLFVFWDDLYFVPSDLNETFRDGIFTKRSVPRPTVGSSSPGRATLRTSSPTSSKPKSSSLSDLDPVWLTP
jgi:hypothetical protein